jgi:ferrochelatase
MGRGGNLSRTAVLLLAFGGPRSLDEVAAFLERLIAEKPTRAHVADLQQRYQAIGGASPLYETTMRQAAALENRLKKNGRPLPVLVGMRYAPPLISETLEEIRKKGFSRIILMSLSPYRSAYASEGYYTEVKHIVAGWHERPELLQTDDWHDHPLLCAAWAAKIIEALEKMVGEKAASPVIFTAHSLPQKVASSSPYVRELEETIQGIIAITGPLRWYLAFQSKGRGGDKWLGPEPTVILESILSEGQRQALICPIGFISDHLETLYDLDIVLKTRADKQGIEIGRIPCLNDAAELIEVLGQLVEGALEKR